MLYFFQAIYKCGGVDKRTIKKLLSTLQVGQTINNTNNTHRDNSVNKSLSVISLLECSFANVTVKSYETSMCCVKSQLNI